MSISEAEIRRGLERLAGRDGGLSPKKEETRRRILASISALLQERSLRRISMEEVAERAGVSRGTLYTYAKSKEDLVVQALAEEQLQHRRPLPDSSLPAAVYLRTLVVEAVTCYERMPLLALLVKGDADLLRSLEDRPDVQAAFGGMDDRTFRERAVRAVCSDATPARVEAITALLGVLASAGPHLVEQAPAHGLTPDAFGEALATALVYGIG